MLTPQDEDTATRFPPELVALFRTIAFDGDGTAVASRHNDAVSHRSVVEKRLRLGGEIPIIPGTNFLNIDGQSRDEGS
jgi:hypothetical protein